MSVTGDTEATLLARVARRDQHALATLYDRRTRVARECLAQMIAAWGPLLIEEPIPTNVALAEAARDGRLLFDVDPDSAGAAAYYAAAAEIVARWRRARNGSIAETRTANAGRAS